MQSNIAMNTEEGEWGYWLQEVLPIIAQGFPYMLQLLG